MLSHKLIFSAQATAGFGFRPTHTSILVSWRFCKRMGQSYLSSISEVGASLAATGTELDPGRIRQVHNSFVTAMKWYFSTVECIWWFYSCGVRLSASYWVSHRFDNNFGSEFLVANKYTAQGKIAINGVSNGGKFDCIFLHLDVYAPNGEQVCLSAPL